MANQATPIRVLYIDDDPESCQRIEESLNRETDAFRVQAVGSLDALESALAKGEIDLVLSVLQAGQLKWEQVLEAVHGRDDDLPVVFVLDADSETAASQTLRAGAAGSIGTGPQDFRRLPHTLRSIWQAQRWRVGGEQAEQARRRAVQRLQALHAIDRAILAARSLEEIAQGAMQHIRRLVPCQSANVTLLVGQGRPVRILASLGMENMGEMPIGEMPVAPGWLEILERGEAFVVPNLSQTGGLSDSLEPMLAQGIRSLVSVPIQVPSTLYGSLNLAADRTNGFSDEDIDIAREVADSLAVAIHQHHLLGSEIAERRLAQSLAASARDLSATLDLGRIFDLTLDRLGEVVPFNSASLVLLREDQGDLVASRGFKDLIALKAARREVKGVFPLERRLVATRQPVVVADVRLEADWVDVPGTEDIRSWLGVPIQTGDRVFGYLILDKAEVGFYTSASAELVAAFAAHVAIAIRNARLFEVERRLADQMTALHSTSLALTGSPNLPTLLESIVEQAARLLDAAGGGLYLCDSERQEVKCVVSYNTPQDYTGLVFKYGEGAAGRVAQTGQPLIIDDYRQWQNRAAVFEGEQPFRAVISVPMRWQGQVIGVLHVLNDSALRRFTTADQELLVQFANQATIAVENARLLAAEQEARRQAETLRETTAALTASLDLNQVLESILTQLRDAVPYDSASVMLLEHGDMQIVAARDFRSEQQYLPLLNLEAYPHLMEVIETRRSLVIAETHSDSRWQRLAGSEYIRSWLGAPLVVTGEVIGLLNLDKEEPGFFHEGHQSQVMAYANQAAIAIQNARLFEQVRLGRERLQRLSAQLLEVQERERRRIALELHDRIGQSLTAVKISLQAAQRMEDPEKYQEAFEQAIAITERALQQARNLSLDLRPSMLDDLGLVAALRWFVDRQAQQAGFKAEFKVGAFDIRPHPDIETACFRVAQEALTNIMRHASAGQVEVGLDQNEGQLCMTIEDDGIGFDVQGAVQRAVRGGSIGLLGMQERAQLLGGKLEIHSQPGKGSVLIAFFPLSVDRPLERRAHRRGPYGGH